MLESDISRYAALLLTGFILATQMEAERYVYMQMYAAITQLYQKSFQKLRNPLKRPKPTITVNSLFFCAFEDHL